MNFGIYPELTKTYILERITQEQIFEHYLNVVVDLDQNILSPFRGERSASAGFYYDRRGKLRLNDMGGDFHGDCFDAVGYMLHIDSSTKKGFKFILHTVAKDFRIHKYENGAEVKKFYEITQNFNSNLNKVRRKVVIRIKAREYNEEDWKFWGNIATPELLGAYKVYAVEEAYMQKGEFPAFRLYNYHYTDPCYAYYFGRDSEGEEQWRLYFPFRDKTEKRFITNCYILQGEKQMTITKFGLITKSYKDVIALKSFGISSVAPSSEKSIVSPTQANAIKTHYNFVFVMMDYDRQGIRNMLAHRKEYRFTNILFTDTINPGAGLKGCKDFTDFINKFGREETKALIDTMYSKYKESFEHYYKTEQQLLNWI